MSKVLVIDDDRAVLRLAEKGLSPSGFELLTASSAEDGMELLRRDHPDVLVLDIMLPETSGIELAGQVRAFDPRLPVIFITVSDDSAVAIEAMKLGAYEYVLKPLAIDQLRDVVNRALESRRLMQSPVHIEEPSGAPAEGDILVGRSPAMLEVYKQIGRVAAQDVAVLIRGESGTGKELIARAIYQHSRRQDHCFLAVNCAALSDTLLESELFGHEKGAFTGADRQRIGKFEQCHEGTIFLDEVGDMSPLTQSKVLRLLQEQRFERVGGAETIEVDVRVVSATNRDLEAMIEQGEFRLDLFHRLNAFQIQLPPLRERGDDLRSLIDHFMARCGRELAKEVTGISHEAIALLLAYQWPGNIRELQSVIRKAMLMATGPVLLPEFLPEEVRAAREGEMVTADSVVTPARRDETDLAQWIDQLEAAHSTDLHARALEGMERYLLTRVLRTHDGNQTKAAEQLGITRGSLRHKIKTLGITIGQIVETEES